MANIINCPNHVKQLTNFFAQPLPALASAGRRTALSAKSASYCSTNSNWRTVTNWAPLTRGIVQYPRTLNAANGTVRFMRIRSPSSRATPQIRFLIFDVIWAALSPLLALYIRDAYVLSYEGALTAGIYCLVSLIFSLIAFAAFGIRDGMPRYFSVHDAIALAKAV